MSAFRLLTLVFSVAWSAAAACDAGPAAAAARNAATLTTLAWSPFGRAERGWAQYAPRLGQAIGSACAADTPGFAAALARWQRAAGLPATGAVDPATFAAAKARWQAARPFAARRGGCPAPPPASALATARPAESYGGKTIRLRPRALAAYRAMVAAARADSAAIRAEPRSLQIYSAFRDPDADAARCAREGNCDGARRAKCSPHRTGLALDLWVGNAIGYGPDSTVDVNRQAMAANPAYRWLVANAARFGFVNYAFEPWHWEWTGEAI